MNGLYHPTRLDHFPRKKGAEALKTWLQDHNLPVSEAKGDHAHVENVNTMLKATGSKERF
jgi:hypothetical protein